MVNPVTHATQTQSVAEHTATNRTAVEAKPQDTDNKDTVQLSTAAKTHMAAMREVKAPAVPATQKAR